MEHAALAAEEWSKPDGPKPPMVPLPVQKTGRVVAVLLRVHRKRLTDRAEVRRALDAVGLLPGPAEHRQEDSDQHRDDANDYKEFHEGKTKRVGSMSTSHSILR
jgi:hypothetical protein